MWFACSVESMIIPVALPGAGMSGMASAFLWSTALELAGWEFGGLKRP